MSSLTRRSLGGTAWELVQRCCFCACTGRRGGMPLRGTRECASAPAHGCSSAHVPFTGTRAMCQRTTLSSTADTFLCATPSCNKAFGSSARHFSRVQGPKVAGMGHRRGATLQGERLGAEHKEAQPIRGHDTPRRHGTRGGGALGKNEASKEAEYLQGRGLPCLGKRSRKKVQAMETSPTIIQSTPSEIFIIECHAPPASGLVPMKTPEQ